jgi:hypothetical protein
MAFNHQRVLSNKNGQGIIALPSILFTATTAALSTAFVISMARRTGFATVVFTFFADCIAKRNNAEARFTSTFHGCNSSHNLNSEKD